MLVFRYFTIATANESLPKVIEKFQMIKTLKTEIVKTEQELNSSLAPNDTFEKYVSIKQKLNSAVKKYYQAIEDLEDTGVVIKGIDEGLLDFPSKRFDGQPTVLMTSPYVVAGCTLPPPSAANGPCVTAQWVSGTTRVTSSGQPLLVQSSQAVCTPTGTPLIIVATQIRVSAL